MKDLLIGIGVLVGLFAALNLAWRWASRRRELPCPTLLAWMLESEWINRFNGTETTLRRLALRPGLAVVEFGPGPGRLLLPISERVMPGGEAIGVELQQGMADRLERRAAAAGCKNLRVVRGDATQPHLPSESCDLVILCTALGEIPDRAAALAQAWRVLRPGGRLAVTEMAGDPHYQFRGRVDELAKGAGFLSTGVEGGWWFYTATYVKP